MILSGLTKKKNRLGVEYYENSEGQIKIKICTKCLELKSVSEFNKSKKGLGGKRSECKSCESVYRSDNKARIAKTTKKWRENNAEYLKGYQKEYREKNRDRILKVEREYYYKNRERRSLYYRKWIEENADRKSAMDLEYERNNPEKKSLYRQRRRARRANLPDTLTHEQQEEILERFEGGCSLTADTEDIQMDHVIPLSIGHGGTVFGNIIPLRASLNSSKQDRNIFDWFADNKERFNLSQRKFDELIAYLAEINDMTPKEYEEYVRWCHDNPREVGSEREVTQ